jgi:hypothetical protein
VGSLRGRALGMRVGTASPLVDGRRDRRAAGGVDLDLVA